MKHFFVFCLFIIQCSILSAKSEIDSLLVQLETAMEKRALYDSDKNKRIEQLKTLLDKEDIDNYQEFYINNQLADEYLTYTLDSALHYLQENLALAKHSQNTNRTFQTNVHIADILATTGRHFEAYEILKKIDKSTLEQKYKIEYFKALIKVFNEVSFYAPIANSYKKYYSKVETYTDSLIPYLDKESDEYLSIQEKKYRDQRNLIKCKQINTQRLSKTQIGSHQYSLITFERSLLYELENNDEMRMKYLTLSATSDIMSSVKDNASLTELALILHKKGEIKKAHKYIKFSFEDASFFNSELRFKVISEILPVINEAYQFKTEKQQKRLRFLVFTISILLVSLLIALLFIHKQVMRLSATKNELSKVNTQLKKLNENLADSNNKLNQINDELSESNHVKEHYIGFFLSICSDYIDKLDLLNKTVNKKIANRKFEELFKETKSRKLIDNEIKEFYFNFDDAFLHIFPNFVQDFNTLLLSDEQIQLKSEERLNTELRIFALIRLGIKDSSKIAKLLRYSVNTIYNYRVKIKNKAKGDRNNFENDVLNIDATQDS